MADKNSTSDKPNSLDVARYRANYLAEQEGAYLYTKLAAVGMSLILSVFGLFGIGAGVSLTASSPLWKAGARQILLGLLAAGITFGLGKIIASAAG